MDVYLFFEIGIILILATVFAYLARILKQPLIPAYILTGVVLGPVFHLVQDHTVITTLSEIGVAFLLFIVGLEIDLRKLKQVGLVSTLGGIIQVVAIFAICFIAALLLGLVAVEAMYIAIGIAFSSTMVVVKLLSDKKQIDTLHGKIIIGILLLQDLIAIIALSVLATLGDFSLGAFLISLAKIIGVIAGSIIIAKYTFPSIFNYAAKSQELLFISAVSASLLYAMVFGYFDFSIAIGAFIAGISLANLPYNIEIISKVKPLRDFFSVLFFATLGMNLAFDNFMAYALPLVGLLFVAMLLKPIATMLIIAFFGYRKRVSFLSGLYIAQISEFSLILVAQGLAMGHVSQELYALSILLAVITITCTTYLVKFEDILYHRLAGGLHFLDRFSSHNKELPQADLKKNYYAIVCGYKRIGFGAVQTLQKLKKQILVVDYDPAAVVHLGKKNIDTIYGDIGDSDLLESLPFRKAKILISTIPTKMDNLLLIKSAKAKHKNLTIIVNAMQVHDAFDLYDAGADYVVVPHLLGGKHVSLLIEDFSTNIHKILEHKNKHLHELKEHRHLSNAHPMMFE